MHIRKATLADASDMATVASNAMLEDEFVSWLCPRRREKFDSFRGAFLRRSKKRFWSGATMLVMVTDEREAEWDGIERVIAYLAMTRSTGPPQPPSFWDTINAKLHWLEERYTYYLRLETSIDYGHLDAFAATLGHIEPLAPYKDHWDLEHLSVDNNFQRRGIGQQMVKAAQDVAAKDGFPLILLASVKGTGTYTKCGFKKVGEVELGGITSPAMVWTPRPAPNAQSTPARSSSRQSENTVVKHISDLAVPQG